MNRRIEVLEMRSISRIKGTKNGQATKWLVHEVFASEWPVYSREHYIQVNIVSWARHWVVLWPKGHSGYFDKQDAERVVDEYVRQHGYEKVWR